MKDKLIVITGATGVLCSEMVREFAARGARVVMIARNKDNLNKLEREIELGGGWAKGISVDCTDKASVEAAADNVYEQYGACDVLINGAGGNRAGATTGSERLSMSNMSDSDIKTFFDLNEEDMSMVHKTNFTSSFIVSQAFGKRMVSKGGSIINISSMSAMTPLTKVLGYSVAKSAINSLTQWLATYFAGVGIRVNAIAPGFFASTQNRGLLYNTDGTLSSRGDKIIKSVPMSRFGAAKELLGAIMWLADQDASSYVTGVIIPIDGGYSAYSGV